MATYSKRFLSESVNGKAILVSGTATASANTVHTAVSGTSSLDEIWLYAVNTSTTNVKLTIEYGETTSPNGHIEVTVLGESGAVCIVPGFLLQNALVVKAFAATTNVITLYGFVNRVV